MESSPIQRLMSRRTRTLLPVRSLLTPEVVDDVEQLIKEKRRKAKQFHDRSSKALPELHIGQPVWVRDVEKHKTRWREGICKEKLSPRSYIVETEGRSLRRNWQDIRTTKATIDLNPELPTHPIKDATTDSILVPSDERLEEMPEAVDQQPVTKRSDKSTQQVASSENDTQLESAPPEDWPATNMNGKNNEQRPPVSEPNIQRRQPKKYLPRSQTSTRSTKMPAHLSDYQLN